MATKYDDYEEYLKKVLAAKGIHYFGPLPKEIMPAATPRPMLAHNLGTLHPSHEPAAPAAPVAPVEPAAPAAPDAPFVPTNPAEQDAMGTALMSGPSDLVNRIEPRMRQFTVAFPTGDGLQVALRVTLQKDGDLILQGPMAAYATKVLRGRPLTGAGLESGHAGFYRLARTTWGPGSQVFKVNVD